MVAFRICDADCSFLSQSSDSAESHQILERVSMLQALAYAPHVGYRVLTQDRSTDGLNAGVRRGPNRSAGRLERRSCLQGTEV